jgi:YesN/AraC family two-component response regulator
MDKNIPIDKLGLEVLWTARYDYNAGWRLERHSHSYYQIIYILEGTGQFYLSNKEYEIIEQDLFFIRPEEVHGLNADKQGNLKTLDIKFRIEENPFIQELATIDNPVKIADSSIKDLLHNIRREGINRHKLYKELAACYLFQILINLIRLGSDIKTDSLNLLQSKNDTGNSACVEIIDYIKKNYSERISLDNISNAVGYNKSYICKVFKIENNRTVMEYLYLYRIQKAKELIIYSDYTLKQISEMTGFESIHHFTRTFQRFEDISPGRWREKEKEGIRKDIYINEGFNNKNFTKK